MRDNRQSFSWILLIGDGLLLLCALTGFVGSFLSLYDNPSGRWLKATALDYCAANGNLFLICAALFGLTTLVVWSLPRFRGAAAGGLAVLWAGIVLWNRAGVVRGAGVTVRDISALFASRVYWGQTFSYKTGLFPAQEAGDVQLFLLLALAGQALLLGWAVVRSRRWWVVLALTLPPLLPGLLADLYPDWLPFMALAACWCAMLLTALCRWAAPDRRGRLTLVVFPAVALALALITVLFPREGYTRPAWARKAQNDFLNITSRLSDYFPHWDNGLFPSTVTYVGAAEEANLANAGPLNYTGRTVLRVTSDYDGWMYLRGSSLAVYEGGVWKALPEGTYDAYWSGHDPEVFPLYFPATLGQDSSPVYTLTVDNVGAVGTCVYTPYFLLPQNENRAGMLPVEDAYLARKQGQWTHSMTFVDREPEAGDGPGRAAAFAYAGYAYDNYLDVPEDLREILDTYARYAMGYLSYESLPLIYDSQRIRVAKQISAYLDAHFRYDASAPAAPEGVDPVYYFLAESNRGYCMHYASAATLMLRAVGIPARYVSGFAAEISSRRQTDIPDRAAHAWVEVWVDGFGWYPVEVTPADAFAWARPDASNPDRPVEDTPEPTLEPTPEPTETPESTDAPDQPTGAPDQPTATLPGSGEVVEGPGQGESGPDFSALFDVLKKAAPVIGALLLIWFVQFVVKRFRVWRMAGADANHSALVCYGYLRRLERWGGRIDARAVELAQKARFSQHTLTGEELSFLRYLADRERTRLCVVTGLPQRLVFRYWWGMPGKPVPPADWTPPQKQEK